MPVYFHRYLEALYRGSYSGRFASTAAPPQDFGCVSFVSKWSEGRCSSRNCRACGEVVSSTGKLQLCFLGRSCGILGKLTTGKPYWCHPGARFGHFVGDVEAKSGYGDFKWFLASCVGSI